MPLPDDCATTLDLPDLPVLRARVTLRLHSDARFPRFKGAMLRGGFGYAFQRTSCPQACWNHSDECAVGALCPFRWTFETPRPEHAHHLHNLQDVPRPFVIEPPLDGRTDYRAGDALEFHLVLVGRGIDYLPYFLASFEQLGRMGLGREQTRATLEQVVALAPWQPTGTPIYRDGRVVAAASTAALPYPTYNAEIIAAHAAALPRDLQVTMHTPLRVKARGAFIEQFDLAAIVQATCWRLAALAAFHGREPWEQDYRASIQAAAAVPIERAQMQWVDWERTSTRNDQPRRMKLGGIVGSAVLRDVPLDVRRALVVAGLLHVGKACVFGHGQVGVSHL